MAPISQGSRACGRSGPLGGGITVVRPLLAFSRADTQACCEDLGLPVWHDSTNSDRQFSRNRLRLDVMPELEGLNPGATQHLARTAQLLEELEGQHSALEALALEAIRSEPGSWELDRQRWQQQPIELQKRLASPLGATNQPAAAQRGAHHRNLAATAKARATAAHCLEPWLAAAG